MVETAPAAAVVLAEALLLLQVQIVALDAPAELGEEDQSSLLSPMSDL